MGVVTDAFYHSLVYRVVFRAGALKLVVWSDPRSEFAPFVSEVRGGARPSSSTVSVTVTCPVVAENRYAARRNGSTSGRGFCDACHKSHFVCPASHDSGVVFVSKPIRIAISAEIAERAFRTRDNWTL